MRQGKKKKIYGIIAKAVVILIGLITIFGLSGLRFNAK